MAFTSGASILIDFPDPSGTPWLPVPPSPPNVEARPPVDAPVLGRVVGSSSRRLRSMVAIAGSFLVVAGYGF